MIQRKFIFIDKLNINTYILFHSGETQASRNCMGLLAFRFLSGYIRYDFRSLFHFLSSQLSRRIYFESHIRLHLLDLAGGEYCLYRVLRQKDPKSKRKPIRKRRKALNFSDKYGKIISYGGRMRCVLPLFKEAECTPRFTSRSPISATWPVPFAMVIPVSRGA